MPFCYFSAFEGFSEESRTSSLSLIPNLHSGMPESWVLTMTYPMTSAFKTVPLLDIRTLMFSTMSMKSSLYLYLMSGGRQEILPVAYIVICLSFSMFYTF